MSYGERLQEAIDLAQSSRALLADAVKMTQQNVGQCIRGISGAFTAENSAKAADFLKVDHYWLATGEGKPRPDRAWPFELFPPEDYYLLPKEDRDASENALAGAIMRLKAKQPRAA